MQLVWRNVSKQKIRALVRIQSDPSLPVTRLPVTRKRAETSKSRLSGDRLPALLGKPWKGKTPLLGFSVLVVLRDEGPEIVDLFLVLDAGEGHLGTGHLRLRVLDVFLE